ncbi:hypothetical protein KFK09_011696 [Dendrobium nobile]|uniref:Rab-GAP TBC domain-containing protein n=1 Tax=Dendrobium nobile TaxID=94219 RepID=A0A8T3BF99_DENNO|nr:hypothetical protein KFK09_011696 [Dendrobium nobile]
MEIPLPDSFSIDRSSGGWSRFSSLRGVRWRFYLGILPSSPSVSIDDLRRVTADARRSYASLRRRLLIDPHIPKDGNKSPDLSMDNPLSQNPESTWGRFFRNAELEKMLEQDLSRLYPEDDHYFQTLACQAMLRRILLVWCLRHPECGYRQGMHELLAPLVYVLHVDLNYLSQVRGLYEDHFNEEFDGADCEVSSNTLMKAKSWDLGTNADDFNQIKVPNITSFDDLDRDIRDVLLLSDSYGAEGELGIVLSEKFMEHDAYCMFDGLMSGARGVVAITEFFCSRPSMGSSTGLPPIIEASSALYHLLSIVDSSLHCHLIELGVEPQYFALRWLRVLFGREFSLSDLLVIWDELFSALNCSCTENDEYRFRILCSPRGAFISAMAVAMLQHVRSSLLAAENATSCLKRILNFPRNISVEKLIKKARFCQVLALETNMSVSSKAGLIKISSLAVRTGSPTCKSPIQIMPDSYWEEKWKVLQKTPQNSDSVNAGQIKGLLGETLESSRTESYTSPAKTVNMEKDAHSFDKRCLFFDDLSQIAESLDDVVQRIPFCEDSPSLEEDVKKCLSEEPGYESSVRTSECMGEESLSTGNSSVFSMNTNPNSEANDPEIESEKSGVASVFFSRENEDGNNLVKEECSNASYNSIPKESEAHADVAKSGPSVNVEVKGVSGKVRKTAAGKFQWFWRIGKVSFNEKSMDKGAIAETLRSSNIGKECVCQEHPTISASDYGNCADSARAEVGDMKTLGTLKILAQSMLENIQVIETVFQQEKVQTGKNFYGNEQAAAIQALKELRKISTILSEI